MIRFSAALVAVAIGVLIGGIATSKLLLVYIAIVVSAVALVALAIGVVLKRAELFGEGQGLVPAGAGAAPLPQARASDSGSEGQDKVPVGAHVAPPPPFQAAAGGYAAFDGTVKAASPSAGADPSAARTAAAGQGRPADREPPWETQAARGPWSSPTPDWMPSGQDERAVSAGTRAPSAWQQGPAPTGTPGGRAGGWGAPSADAQAAAKAPRSWAAPSPSVSPDAPAVKPGAGSGAGSGAATPSWFDRLGGQADAPPTVAAPTIASPPVPGTSGSGDAPSGDDGAGDEDDDWPTRYSWLDDDTDESGEASPTVASVVADAEPERNSPDPAGDAGPADAGSDDIASGDIAPDAAAPVKATAPGTPRSATETADAATLDAGVADAAPGDPANATSAGEPDAEIIAFPRAAADTTVDDADGADAGDSTAASETGSEPPSTAEGDAVPGDDLVTVVPGVPRYHRTDCVLIRFMPEADVQKLSIAAAKDTGCTPCAACQPEG